MNHPPKPSRRVAVVWLACLLCPGGVGALAARRVRQVAPPRPVVRLRATLDTGRIETCAFSPASKLVAVSHKDRTVQLWDVAGGRLLRTLDAFKETPVIFWSPDGRRFLTTSWGKNATAGVWDAETGRRLFELSGLRPDTRAPEWSPDGKTIMTVAADNSWKASLLSKEKAKIYLWDAETGRLKSELTVKGESVEGKFSPDGRQVLTTGFKAEAQLWDVSTGRLVATLAPAHSKYQLDSCAGDFLPGGKFVVVDNFLRGVYLWDAATGELKTTVIEQDNGNQISLHGISPDGSLLVIYRERFKSSKSFKIISSVELRESLSGQVRAEMTGRNMMWSVHQVLWSPDERVLVTAGGSHGYEGKIWDAATGQLRATFPMTAVQGRVPFTSYFSNLDRLSFHPALPVLMAASNDHIRFLNPVSGELMQVLDTPGDFAQWSADGQLLLVVPKDLKSLQVWEPTDKFSVAERGGAG